MSQQIDLLFGVKGGEKLSGASGRRIKTQIDKIVSSINQTPRQIVFKADTTALDKVEAQLKSIKDTILTMPKIDVGIAGTGTSGGDLEKLYDKVTKRVESVASKNLKSKGFNLDLSETKEYIAVMEQLDGLSSSFMNSDGTLKNIGTLDKNAISDMEEYMRVSSVLNTKFRAADQATKAFTQSTKTASTEAMSASKMLNKLYTSYNKFSNIKDYPGLRGEYQSLIDELSEKTTLSGEEVKAYTKKINDLENKCYDAGVAADTFGEAIEHKISDRIKYLIGQFAIDFVVQGLRRMYDNVVQIDTAMTELKKVTDETDESYDRFLTNAGKRAKELGATLVEVVQVTSDYARLGYSVDEASRLADAAIVYTNVGDGLRDTNEATDHIISTMKAFGIEAENSMRIIDAFNEVSNKFAVTSSDIGAGLQRSSAAMAAAGNSMEETIALFTAGNTIIRDADSMGTSLKTMSMRLRSSRSDLEALGEDTEGAAESVSSLRKEIKALTGVDIMINDTTYKNTYQILQDISKEWEHLNDITRANVLELLFGKRQANVGAAVIENFDIAEDVLKTAMDSAGSAMAENEKYLDSIQGRLDQLTASFQVLSSNVLDSELVKFGVDFLKLIVDLLNEIFILSHGLGDALKGISPPLGEIVNLIGTLAVIAGGASLIDGLFGFKHVNNVLNVVAAAKDYLKILKQVQAVSAAVNTSDVISKVVGEVLESPDTKYSKETMDDVSKTINKIKDAFDKVKNAAAETGGAIGGFGAKASLAIGVIPIALAAAIAWFGIAYTKSRSLEEQTKKLAEAQNEYNGTVDELENLNQKLKENEDRIRELQNLEKPSPVEQEELTRLEAENKLLEKQIELQEKLVELKKLEYYDTAQDTFEKAAGKTKYGNNVHAQYYSQWQGDYYKAEVDEWQKKLDNAKKLAAEGKDIDISWYESELTERQSEYLTWQQDVITLAGQFADATRAEHIATRDTLNGIINGFTYESDLNLDSLLNDPRFSEILDFMKRFDSVGITNTKFGNIDLNNRQILEWTEENLSKYKEAIESWGFDPSELSKTISTVLGSSSEYDGVEIAFSPVLQTKDGAVLLTQSAVDEYIYGLIEKAGESWTAEDLFALDKKGLIIDGQKINNILAAVGDNAIEVGEAMHYLGTNGEIDPTSIKNFESTVKGLGYTVEDVEKSVDALYSSDEDVPDFSIDTTALESARESVKNLSSECKNMADAFKEQNENGALSVDTILDIIDAGYAAALVVDQETGSVKLNADMYIVLAKAKIAERVAALEVQKSSLQNTVALAKEEIAALKAAEGYAALARNQAGVYHLTSKIEAAELEIAALDAQISALNNIDLSDITSGIYGIGDAASSAKSKLSNLQSGMENLLSQTISWLKQEYSSAQEAQERYYDSQIDALEDAKDAAKERWDAEKEALEDAKDSYNDLIDAQLELLKRQKEADDYAKSKAEKEDAVADIENQLLAIENDDSIEAQKMRLELQEQLKEAKDELDELQADREYELREQALQDEKDRYNDEVDAKLDAIEKQSEAEQKAYEDRIDRLRDYLDAVRDAEKTEAQWRAEAYDWIENHEEELYQNLIEWNRIYGDGRDSTVEQWFKEAEGWRAWGDTFEEARNNLARYLYELAEAVGGVAKTTASLLEDLLKQLADYEQQLLDQNDKEGAKMIESLQDNLEKAVRNGMQFSEEMLTNMLKVFENGVDLSEKAILKTTNDTLGWLNTLQSEGDARFRYLWQHFRSAMETMNADQFIALQGMVDNLEVVILKTKELEHVLSKTADKGYEITINKNGFNTGSVSEYSEGGVIDYTGPAAVHGSKSNPEVVFNADAAAKLYNYVVNTPDLLKSAFASITADSSMLKGASQVNNSPSIGDININIAGNADADTVLKLKQLTTTLKDEVVKSLNESMSRRGISRSPRTI